jgi:hypothetical protein
MDGFLTEKSNGKLVSVVKMDFVGVTVTKEKSIKMFIFSNTVNLVRTSSTRNSILSVTNYIGLAQC